MGRGPGSDWLGSAALGLEPAGFQGIGSEPRRVAAPIVTPGESLMTTLPALAAALLASVPAGSALRVAEFTVAPGGRDAWPGTPSRPFATLERARDAVRAALARGPRRPVTVWVRGGVYPLARTLAFGPADSGAPGAPVVYRAAPGERPILTGGLRVDRWTRERGGVLRANLAPTPLSSRPPRVLVWDGRRMEMARWPNADPTDPHGGRWAYVDGKRIGMYSDSPVPPGASPPDPSGDFWQRNIPELTRTLRMRPADARGWARPEEGEVSVFPRFNWSHWVLPIERVEDGGRTLRLKQGAYYEVRPGDRYFVRGLAEELDAPGEWHFDRRSSTLRFRPPGSVAGKPAWLARVGDAVVIDQCAHLTLRGLTIECADGSGVTLRDGRGVTVAGCTIRNVGDIYGAGVVVEGGRDNAVVGCDIHDTGHAGIRLGGGEHFTLTPGGNRADNNVIHHVGRVGRGAPGVALTGARNHVTHNLIHDTPHSGILIWGSAHAIEYNRIRHTCLETEDAGAIGGGAIDWLSWLGCAIRFNWIQDTIGYGFDEQGGRWRSPYFASALYPDWAASGLRIEGNALIRAPMACLLLHSGRDNLVENNLLVDGGVTQTLLQGWTVTTGFWSTMVAGWVRNYEAALRSPAWRAVPGLVDPRTVPLPDGRVMTGNVFRRNVVAYRTRGAWLHRWEDVPLERNHSLANLVWHGGRPLRTGMLAIREERGPNLLANPGVEEGPAGGYPVGWSWHMKAHAGVRLFVEEGAGRGGGRALAIVPGFAPPGTSATAVTMVAAGPSLPFRPGTAYVLRAWLRGEGGRAPIAIQAYTWKEGAHSWIASRSVPISGEWVEHRLEFRTPAPGDPAYRPTMDFLTARLVASAEAGRVWIDDVSLREADAADEWEAWRARGMDRDSVVADPLFVDPSRDDYRLRPGSPALRLGFRPLPFERMGPYRSPLRASWPIVEAPGAREALARRKAAAATPRDLTSP